MCTKSEMDFSVNILKILTSKNETDKSVVYSPISILNVLAAIFAGSDDITAKELAHVLGEENSKNDILEHYSNIIKYCKNVNNKFNDGSDVFKLLFSNCMFLSNKESLLPSFLEEMKKFETQYQQLDFKDSKNSAEEINEMVSQDTDKQINNIVTETDVKSDENLFIVIALFFFGEWETPFEEIVHHGFFSNPKLKRRIQMMYRTIKEEEWNFTEGETWSCLGIPYKNRKMWLHVVLPKKRYGLSELMDKFNGDLLKECIAKKRSEEIIVQIPVFQFENKMLLNESLEKLGITQIFNGHGIRNISGPTLHGVKIIQSTKIHINQYGMTPTVETYSEPVALICHQPIKKPSFNAFYPFLYFVTLVENNVDELKSILIMGTYC